MTIRARDVKRFAGIHEIAIAIALGVVLCAGGSWLLWREAYARGRDDQKVEQLKVEKAATDKKIVVDRARSDSAKRVARSAVAAADSAAKTRDIARKKIELKGDTATTPSGSQVLLPEIADYIRTADAAAPKELGAREELSGVIALQDTLEGDHVKREKIDDEQTRILEREKRPRFGIKTGIAIGAAGVLAIIKVAALVIK